MRIKFTIKSCYIWNNQIFIITKNDNRVVCGDLTNSFEEKSESSLTLKFHKGFDQYQIDKISFGINHFLALTCEGEILAFGANGCG